MNELLGWYGYDKLDSRDTQGLNLHHFAAQRSPSDVDSSDGSSSPGRRDAGTGSSSHSPPPPDPLSIPPGCTVCGWCQKIVANKQLFSVKTPTGQKAFCSEICFSQCRRANFKRNKTCDWCRHVRHTVNYVDFQDGEHQLQFCSDKCLNQYKMNIFCRETQAHLQMHPHLQDGVPVSGLSGGALITPDMWLRDCCSVSPASDRSPSPPLPAPSAAGDPRHSPPAPTPATAPGAEVPRATTEPQPTEDSRHCDVIHPDRSPNQLFVSAEWKHLAPETQQSPATHPVPAGHATPPSSPLPSGPSPSSIPATWTSTPSPSLPGAPAIPSTSATPPAVAGIPGSVTSTSSVTTSASSASSARQHALPASPEPRPARHCHGALPHHHPHPNPHPHPDPLLSQGQVHVRACQGSDGEDGRKAGGGAGQAETSYTDADTDSDADANSDANPDAPRGATEDSPEAAPEEAQEASRGRT